MELTGLFTQLLTFGPIGLFFAAILANASVLLPLPIEVLVIPLASIDYFGAGILSPLFLGLLVGFGAAIGELVAYFFGVGGNKVLKKLNKEQLVRVKWIEDNVEKYGVSFVALFAFVPFPFDLIGIACGVLKFPMHLFFLGAMVGKIPRYTILCYAGYFGVPWLLALFGISL